MRTLVVSRVPGELRAALLVDDLATDLRIMRDDEPSLVGAIFRGRILRVMPALPGAFVEIGQGRPGFLPATKAKLVEGAPLVVRVVKDAHGDKGAELRIDTSSVEIGTGRLDQPPPLTQLLEAFQDRFDELVVDERSLAAEARRAGIEARFDGSSQFDELTGLQAAFDGAIAARLDLAGGGRIAFDYGTAFTQIDVDLGSAADTRRSAAESIRATNIEAATVIARHLQLRNIGGAIVVDFISMTRQSDRAAVEATLRTGMTRDVVAVELHGWTRLGHLELTRQRTSRSIADYLLSTTTRKTPATVAWEALRALRHQPFEAGGWRLQIHPGVEAELSGRLKPCLDAVVVAMGQPVTINSDAAIDPELFDIRP